MSWPEVPIGDACELVNGRAFKPEDWSENGLPIVRIQNLNNLDAPFNRYDGEVRDRFLIDSGVLLFSWSGTPGTSFGAFFWDRGPAILNQHIFNVLVRPGIDKNYFRYALNSRVDRIIDQAHGGVGLKHITKDRLEATTVPLPPLPEQKRIAAILDKADEIRRKRAETIRLTEELLKSAFLEMFGDPVTNPKDEVVRLGSVVHVKGGKRLPKGAEYADGPTAHPYIRVTDITTGRVDQTELRFLTPEVQRKIRRYTISSTDVMISIAGTIGLRTPNKTWPS